MSTNGAGWLETIFSNKTARNVLIIAFSLFVLSLLTVVSVGLTTNKHIKIGFLEFNSSDENKKNSFDSLVPQPKTANKIDSVHIPVKTEPEHSRKLTDNSKIKTQKSTATVSKGNIQKIDSGSSGLQNNGVNNGLQAGRDINITTERRLHDNEKTAILSLINQAINKYGLKKRCVSIMMASNSNGHRFADDLSTYLIGAGFDVQSGGFFSVPTQNVRVVYDGTDPENDCVIIEIGLITVP